MSGGTASAADFLPTEPAEKTLGIGVRAGFNTANSTIGSKYTAEKIEGWGTGFDAGIVVDIQFREWFAIQPGIFYESRSNKYTYIWHNGIAQASGLAIGHSLDYSINIPVLFSARFNITDNLQWSVDIGPYFSFGIGKHDKGEYAEGTVSYNYDNGYYKHRNRFQSGLKFGTGLEFMKHYYIGVHYMAGMRDVYKDYGGRNKAWSFMLGYNF